MSDDGLINMEDDDVAVPAPAAAVEAPPDPPAEATPPADTPAEVDAVVVGGSNYVPVAALKAEREKRQALEPLAKRTQELEAYVQQNRPYLEFLQANPTFLQQRQQPAAPATPASTEPDPGLVELARSLDLYDQGGQPDISRAAKIRAVMTETAKAEARQIVQPYEEQQTNARAQQNYASIRNMKHPDGTPVNPQIVDFVWQQTLREPNGMKTLANQESAASIGLMVLGADTMWKQQQGKLPPPPAPPLVTEGSGGVPRVAAKMSDLETRVAKERGMSPTAWNDNLRGFKPGASNVLED